MKIRIPLLTLAAVLAAGAFAPLALPVPAVARVVVDLRIGPPPAARFERRGVRPWRDGVWIDGHWGRRGGHWVWISGHWARPYGHYREWVRGHYNRHGDWIEGHWR